MTQSGIIRWAEPPAPSFHYGHNGVRKTFVAMLQSYPGHWAQYKPGHGHNGSVAYGMMRDFPGVEAVTRSRGTKPATFDCYARWVEQ